MRRSYSLAGVILVATMLSTPAAFAAPVGGTGNVTSNVIFGAGNGNGSFTGVRVDSIEVGLRGKWRGHGVYNYDGDHTYTFDASVINAPPTPSTYAGWNFEWSVNTDWDGLSGNKIGDFDYLLQVDTNPGAGTSFVSLDPYLGSNHPSGFFDHSFGDNTTAQSAGVEATSIAEYAGYLAAYNLSQQSWNLTFGFVPAALVQAPGIYTVSLSVLDKGTSDVLAGTSIDVVVNPVPLPAALPLFATGVGALGIAGWRRRRRAAAA